MTTKRMLVMLTVLAAADSARKDNAGCEGARTGG
jgi:hypothetical protein